MHLHLTRTVFSPHATIGELRCGPELLCHVLEDVVRPAGAPKVWGQTAIPAGTYEVVVTYSQRFRQPLPLLMDVPGYEGVRIHSGNSAADTAGCLLVGHYDAHKPDWVANSRATFATLFARLRAALAQGQRVQLTVA
jgi:hypothetical protein